MMARLHCISQQTMLTSKLLGYYSSATRKSIPKIIVELLHFSMHRGMEAVMLYGCCWTTMRMRVSVTIVETLHCIWQQPTVILRLLGYYLSATQRSIPRMPKELPHCSIHRWVTTVMLRGCCWTTLWMSMSATGETSHGVARCVT